MTLSPACPSSRFFGCRPFALLTTQADASGAPAGAVRSSEEPDGHSRERKAIAAAAAAAAVAAGLADPSERASSPDGADAADAAADLKALSRSQSPAAAAAAGAGADTPSAVVGPSTAAAAAAVGGGNGAAAAGSGGVDVTKLGRLLLGLQHQMQHLMKQEQKRSLEVVTLRSKVCSCCHVTQSCLCLLIPLPAQDTHLTRCCSCTSHQAYGSHRCASPAASSALPASTALCLLVPLRLTATVAFCRVHLHAYCASSHVR